MFSDALHNNRIKKEPSAPFRWIVLVFVSFAMFGNYYIYDSISPVADLLAKQLNFSDSDIGLLNAIYSLPNLVMVLVGGIIIDRLGTRLSTFIFALLCLIGAAVTASSGQLEIMAAGRLIFGLGAESLIVAVTTVIGKWFKGKNLSLAFGLNLSLARLGTVAAFQSPNWFSGLYDNWQGPLLLSVAAGVISVVSVIIYWGMDSYASKNLKLREEPEPDKINIKEIFSFSKSYWYLVLLCVTFYSAIFPFKTFAIKYFMEEHGVSRGMGGNLLTMVEASTIFLTPFFGWIVDKVGKRSVFLMIGSLFLLPVYFLLVYTNISLWIPMVIFGLAFSLVPAVIWPSVAIIVKETKLGTALGLMTMVQAVGLTFFNYIIGGVNDLTGSYTMGMWIFSSLGIFGYVFAFLLRMRESGPNGHGLDKGLNEVKADG